MQTLEYKTEHCPIKKITFYFDFGGHVKLKTKGGKKG